MHFSGTCTRLACLMVALAGCDLLGGQQPGNNNTNTNDPACQIQAPREHAPGWPYDLPTFRDQVLPMIKASCAMAGCHINPNGQGGYTVWPDAAPGNCSYAKTFNSLVAKTDLENPQNSAVYVAITGGDPLHPLRVDKTDSKAQLLLNFVSSAAQTQTQGGSGGTPPPPNASPFDYNVFQSQIQPILDIAEDKGCSSSVCHGAPAGAGGLKLVANPAPGSADMLANFNAVTALCDLGNPSRSLFFLQATTRHASGASAVVSTAQAQTLLGWIQTAKTNAPPGGGSPSCVPTSDFSLDVFRTEILPILLGQIDLNSGGAPSTTTGCARSACHGADRTGGALVIKADADPQTVLANVSCFVNLTNPTASEILVCPLNQPGCRRSPHPGQTVFSGAGDLNYQRLVSYLYATKTGATPLDFAYYVRRIDTLFNDVNAVQGGAQNRTCADTISCHGVAIAGQRPPNGSDLGLLPNATGKARLGANFSAASNFINFIQPTGSSLFLYPTDEVAALQNPFATGLHHPGGLDFAIDSIQARSILTFARGLRPDGQGFQPHWLVAGDYAAAAITDPTAIDEANVKPSIFDPDGAAQFNGGQWDGYFPDQPLVDLNVPFPRAQTAGRVAYAVAYILNTSASDIQAQVTITSPNAVKLWVGSQAILQSDSAQAGVTGLALFPAYGTSHGTTRVLLKVLQRSGDPSFGFTVRLQDPFGNPLTDASGELVVKLSPDGGI